MAMAALLAASGCSRKQEKPPERQAAPLLPEPSREPQPGIEFFDAAKQQRYEKHFRSFLRVFEPPQPGSVTWVELWDGRHISGRIDQMGNDLIALATADGRREVRIADMAMGSRTRLFAGEFARNRAMGRMTGELREPPAEPGGPSGTRYAMSDDIVARIGPGHEFRRAPGAAFARGQPLAAQDEFDGWLRVGGAAGTASLWIPKCMTYALDDATAAAFQDDLDALRRSGLLHDIDTAQNEAGVNPEIWRGTDPVLRMGIARTIASYCAAARSNNLVFVTIRDADTQRRLGKYSQAQGWKDATL